MQRLVEQPTEHGDVFAGSVCLGRVHYHLSVYQHFSENESESVPADLDVEGRLTSLEGFDVLVHRGTELTLRLADGRMLDFCWWMTRGGFGRLGAGCTNSPHLR